VRARTDDRHQALGSRALISILINHPNHLFMKSRGGCGSSFNPGRVAETAVTGVAGAVFHEHSRSLAVFAASHLTVCSALTASALRVDGLLTACTHSLSPELAHLHYYTHAASANIHVCV
jgi:hypothetical protein